MQRKYFSPSSAIFEVQTGALGLNREKIRTRSEQYTSTVLATGVFW
jgi:hypothetical protein